MSDETTNPTETAAPEAPSVDYKALYEKLAPLERIVDSLPGGTQQFINLAATGYKAMQTPTTPEPEPEPPTEDLELYDPETKALNAKFDPRIGKLEQENAELQQQLSALMVDRFREGAGRNMQTVLEQFKDFPELQSKAKQQLSEALGSATQEQLAALQSEGGVKTMRMMLIDTYDELTNARLAKNKQTEAPEPPIVKGTDPRVTTRAALPANTVGVRSGVKPSPKMAQELLETITTKITGKDPSVVWK